MKARTRKIKEAFGNLSKVDKAKISQKRLDDLESDVLEGFISSNESLSEFDEEEDNEPKLTAIKKNKKAKKLKKDKRTTLTKSKVNLKQMISDMERKQSQQPTRGINYLSIAAKPSRQPATARLCTMCQLPGKYSCPRCLDRFCDEGCYRHHKEFVCSFMEYNFYF